MEITNFKKKRNFEKNLGEYVKLTEGYQDLGDKGKILTNIEVMQNQFNELKASGALRESDFKHNLLLQHIKDASEYLVITDPNLYDIHKHYSTCQSFQQITSSISGGEKGV